MKTIRVLSLTLLMVLFGMPMTASAQETSQTFSLPEGSIGRIYRTSVEAVLRDKYGMRLQSDRQASVFRWAFAGGEIPPGLALRPNGSIFGTPRVPRETPYQFKLKVSDAAVPMSSGLVITLDLTINASRVKLVPVSVVKIVPQNTSGNLFESGNIANDSAAIRAYSHPFIAPGTANEPKAVQPSRTVALYSDDSFRKETKTDLNSTARDILGNPASEATSAFVPPKPPVDCASLCNPTLAPDEKNDFIIDAVSGTTKGRTRFDKRDRARIFVINKNPFLYEYRITLEDKAVEEQALAAFLKLLGPIGEGTFDEPTEAKDEAEKKRTEIQSRKSARRSLPCPELETLLKLERELGGDPQNQVKGLLEKLRNRLKGLANNFNETNTKYKSAQAILTNPSVRCQTLCNTAGELQTNLVTYLTNSKSEVESFEEDLSSFREKARSLKTLAGFVAKSSADCATEVLNGRLIELGDYYIEAGTKLQATFDELINGRKVLTEVANNINTILSSGDAFHSVYEKGDYDGPTNVLIKVERKSKLETEGENNAKADSEFSTMAEAKLNFGGGPRFALAGGFVFSTLEKPEYQRVPAVINGQNDHIVGLKENSNSRILPILMLHSRLFSRPNWKYVSGVHFSLGLTAKPDNEGTDAEFLVGPSISFIEERLFFTFGGYAGRKQELEGNLTLGQKIPDGFGDELPISKHYVWKPGFAITYKIK